MVSCPPPLVDSRRRSADENSILATGQIPLVWPGTTFEWVLLVGTVVCLDTEIVYSAAR
jgi:hypothetical protein